MRLAAESNIPKTRVQALWTLENLGGLEPGAVVAALKSAEAQVRRNALQIEGRLLK